MTFFIDKNQRIRKESPRSLADFDLSDHLDYVNPVSFMFFCG